MKNSKRDEIAELSDLLIIDPSNLDDELIQQPTLFNKIGQAMAEATSEKDAMHEQCKRVDASKASEIREAKTEGRVTDTAVANAVLESDEHKEAYDLYLVAKTKAERLGILKDAFMQRSSMLRDLVQLHAVGYYMNSAAHPKHGNAGEAAYRATRTKMNDARERRSRD